MFELRYWGFLLSYKIFGLIRRHPNIPESVVLVVLPIHERCGQFFMISLPWSFASFPLTSWWHVTFGISTSTPWSNNWYFCWIDVHVACHKLSAEHARGEMGRTVSVDSHKFQLLMSFNSSVLSMCTLYSHSQTFAFVQVIFLDLVLVLVLVLVLILVVGDHDLSFRFPRSYLSFAVFTRSKPNFTSLGKSALAGKWM